ncbi:hypothetical protein [Cereibacter changlensis]|uniref:hypothetical protein n=1 Tax=Cereibacter changlensis TaxID=402884 RepID=UPI0040331C59
MEAVETLRGTGPRVVRYGDDDWEVLGLPEASPIFRVKADAESWKQAQVALLPKSRLPRMRSCLCCGDEFQSEGYHHRMCNPCRRLGSDVAGIAATISGTRLRRVTR